MKKLMIAAAIVCAAAMSQAAAYTWDNSTGYIYDGHGTATGNRLASGTSYLFNAGEYSQSAMVAAFLGGTSFDTIVSENAIGPAIAISSGKGDVADKFTYDGVAAPGAWKAYYAIVNNGELFISGETDATALSVGTGDITFASQKNQSQTFNDGATSYVGAGWYAAVPEPTSGLLLLLGVAGLALRRRRA